MGLIVPLTCFMYRPCAHAGGRTRGLIRSYGLATWDCLRLPPSDPGHLPLAEAVRLAELAALGSTTGSDGLRHGFEYVQVPVRTGHGCF